MATLPELQTDRLCLRPFRADDVESALQYRNDPESVRFLPHIPYPFTRRDAEVFVATNMSEDWQTSAWTRSKSVRMETTSWIPLVWLRLRNFHSAISG